MKCFRTKKTYHGSRPLLFLHHNTLGSKHSMHWLLLHDCSEQPVVYEIADANGHRPDTFDSPLGWENILESFVREEAVRKFMDEFPTSPTACAADYWRFHSEPEFEEHQDWGNHAYSILARLNFDDLSPVREFMNRLPSESEESDFFYQCLDLRGHSAIHMATRQPEPQPEVS